MFAVTSRSRFRRSCGNCRLWLIRHAIPVDIDAIEEGFGPIELSQSRDCFRIEYRPFGQKQYPPRRAQFPRAYLFPQLLHFFREPEFFRRLRNGDSQLFVAPGFGDVSKYVSGVDRVDRRIDIRIARQDDANRIRRQLFDLLHQGRALNLRHALIGNHHGDVAGFHIA